ncbi:KH domain-containing protein [Rathayibacter sp. CAU 1779]
MQGSWLWIPFSLVAVIVAIVLLAWAARRNARRHGRTLGAVGTPVRYTAHARERMLQRGVDPRQLESVLVKPARVLRDRGEDSVRLEGDFDGRLLKVWVAEPWPSTSEVVVKSTAWTYVAEFPIVPGAVGRVKGRGGQTIQAICRESGAQITVERSGAVRITAGDQASVESARRSILAAADPARKLSARTRGAR